MVRTRAFKHHCKQLNGAMVLTIFPMVLTIFPTTPHHCASHRGQSREERLCIAACVSLNSAGENCSSVASTGSSACAADMSVYAAWSRSPPNPSASLLLSKTGAAYANGLLRHLLRR
jgi:hypothetical protein